MTKNELIELLKDNNLNEKHHISAAALANIVKFANVSLQMDGDTLDYYYEVDIDELVESEMPEAEFTVMKGQGWGIKNNKLVIFI
jgi:hypothetical protein